MFKAANCVYNFEIKLKYYQQFHHNTVTLGFFGLKHVTKCFKCMIFHFKHFPVIYQ